tara:strand:- start:187 stop:417 length:231 start_codon:yes stop_codon:yes gene_type:complete
MALTTQAYGLVKNKNHFSQGPQALLLDYFFVFFMPFTHLMLARLMPREIHADVNAGYSLVELLQEIDEREAKHEES